MYKVLILVFSILLIACNSNSVSKDSELQNDTITSQQTQKEKLDNELERLSTLIALDESNPVNFHNRAIFFLDNEKPEYALEDILIAIQLDSTNSNYYVTLGEIQLIRGKLKPAIEALEKAIQQDNKNIVAMLKLAEMNIIFNRFDEAVKYINKVITLDDLNPKAYFLRGMVWLQKGDTVTGIKNFLKSIDVDQDYYESHMQLGRLYSSKGNELAISYFSNASNIEPTSPEPLYHLGTYYQNIGNTDMAIATYESLLQTTSKYYFALYNIGYIQLVNKLDFEKAISYFDQTLAINPNYTKAWYNRGYAFELLGDEENAKISYQDALNIDPDFELAKTRLENLK